MSLKFISHMAKKENDMTIIQPAKEEILSEETLKEIHSLTARIDSITVKTILKLEEL